MTNIHKEETNLICIDPDICPACGAETVSDFTDDYSNKAGLSADEVDPIYFEKCTSCGWNNGPKN
jgi:hypothetical protein